MSKTIDDFRKQFDPTHESPTEVVFSRPIPKTAKRFIVTAAQNATPVESNWWAVLTKIAEVTDAELLVIPLRYKNPTSIWTASQQNAEHWASEVRPYLWNKRYALNQNISVIGDVKIPPTKSTPLSGFDAMSGVNSAIFGHPKLQLTTVPTPSSRMAKVLMTTGVCTKQNYTDSGLGKISEFHHSLSAIMVEIDGKRFYTRQLHYDKKTQSCTDLGTKYTATAYGGAAPALALVMGDMHIRFLDPKVETARSRLIELVNPQHRLWHDTLDSYSCTPHHEGNPFIQQGKQAAGWDNVKREVDQALTYIADQRRDSTKDIIVPSNHDDMLSRWIKRADWKQMSQENAQYYLSTALLMSYASKMTKQGVRYPDPFGIAVKAALKHVHVLDRDESFALAGVELGMHGDHGPNGARGSRKNLRRIGVKSIIGHAHSPGIDEGCYQTGTSTYLRLEYNHGASGWLNADVLLNADGKRQMIIYVDGQYRLES